MGFKLIDKGAIREAMTLVDKYTKINMTEDDKKNLGFGAIFVEHMFCKCIH